MPYCLENVDSTKSNRNARISSRLIPFLSLFRSTSNISLGLKSLLWPPFNSGSSQYWPILALHHDLCRPFAIMKVSPVLISAAGLMVRSVFSFYAMSVLQDSYLWDHSCKSMQWIICFRKNFLVLRDHTMEVSLYFSHAHYFKYFPEI